MNVLFLQHVLITTVRSFILRCFVILARNAWEPISYQFINLKVLRNFVRRLRNSIL